MPKGEKLSVKQEAFCLHYAKSGNATQAYKDAGYKHKTDTVARVESTRLLANPNIKARLQQLAEQMASEKIADCREIQEILTEILRGQKREEQIVVESDLDGCSTARIMERKPQMKDVIKAGETLAKMQGGFDNKVQVEITVPVFGGEDELED